MARDSNAHVTLEWEADTDRDPATGQFVRQYRCFEVSGSVGSYTPARIYGPPERCSPAEGGEAEIEEVTEVLYERRHRKLRKVGEERADVSTLEALGLYEQAIEALAEQAVSDDEAAADDEADRRYDEWRDDGRRRY